MTGLEYPNTRDPDKWKGVQRKLTETARMQSMRHIKDEDKLFSEEHGEKTRSNGHKLQHDKFQTDIQEKILELA